MRSPRARRRRRARSWCESALAAPADGPLVGVRINSLASGLADADLDALAPALLAHRADHRAHGRGPRRDPSRRRAARRARARSRRRPRAASRSSPWPRPRAACSPRARSRSASPRLRTFIFGPADLGKELGVEPTADGFEHLHARSAIVLAARAAGKEGPVDGPYLKLDDDEGCAVSSAWARRLGLPGQGRPAPAAAADRGRGVRAGRARAGLGARGRPRLRRGRGSTASPRSSSPTARSSTTPWPSAPATSCVRATAEHRILRAMKVERIRKAYEQVADQLLSMINSGELKPGDRLPSEAELAADFGVSRTTVREALRILATRNLIHTRKGMAGGHFIVEPTVGSISEFLVANYGLLTAANTVTLEHLLQAREMIEGPAAAIAARNARRRRSREAPLEPQRRHLGGQRGRCAGEVPQLPPVPARGDQEPAARRRRRADLHGAAVDHRSPPPDQGGDRRDRAGSPEDLRGGRGPRRGRGAPPDGRAPRLPARQLPAGHQLDRGLRPAQASQAPRADA